MDENREKKRRVFQTKHVRVHTHTGFDPEMHTYTQMHQNNESRAMYRRNQTLILLHKYKVLAHMRPYAASKHQHLRNSHTHAHHLTLVFIKYTPIFGIYHRKKK